MFKISWVSPLGLAQFLLEALIVPLGSAQYPRLVKCYHEDLLYFTLDLKFYHRVNHQPYESHGKSKLTSPIGALGLGQRPRLVVIIPRTCLTSPWTPTQTLFFHYMVGV